MEAEYDDWLMKRNISKRNVLIGITFTWGGQGRGLWGCGG